MYKPISLYIGLRYIRGHISDRFFCFTSMLSTIGITLGVMSLIIVLSVMNGLDRELRNNVFDLIPQVILTTSSGMLNTKYITKVVPERLKDVVDVAPLITGDIILQSTKSIAVGVMIGINPDNNEPLFDHLINNDIERLEPGKYLVVLGNQLASNLGVKKNDKVRLIAQSIRQITPMGEILSQRLFTVAGIYITNSEVDGYEVLVNQQDASRLMNYPIGYITGWRIWLNDPLSVNILSKQYLPNGLIWKDWREKKGELFQAASMEKNIIRLFIFLILIVALLNIAISLGLFIFEKRGEIAILQTYGLTKYKIMLIFMVQGSCCGIVGSLLGTFLGLFFSEKLNYLIPFIDTSLKDVILPTEINLFEVTIIVSISIIATILSTLYPSWYAAYLNPAKALRYE